MHLSGNIIIQQYASSMLLLNTNYMEHLCKADSRLAKIISEIGSYSIKIRNDSFQSLVEAIIYQQLTGRAANTIYKRLLAYYDDSISSIRFSGRFVADDDSFQREIRSRRRFVFHDDSSQMTIRYDDSFLESMTIRR